MPKKRRVVRAPKGTPWYRVTVTAITGRGRQVVHSEVLGGPVAMVKRSALREARGQRPGHRDYRARVTRLGPR